MPLQQMKSWSDPKPHPAFCTIFFLDTNILVHIIDRTHESLNHFVEYLGESTFASLISADYALFEFINVRKQEHYLRIAARNFERSATGEINFGELLKQWTDRKYEIPVAPFDTAIVEIRTRIDEEKEKLTRDYHISFDDCIMHRDQLMPTFEICLSSRISNKDSLLLVSATMRDGRDPEKNVVFITKDKEFAKDAKDQIVSDAMDRHGLLKPNPQDIRQIDMLGGSQFSLIDIRAETENHTKCREILLYNILQKQDGLLIGRTSLPTNGSALPGHIYFKVDPNRMLPSHSYLTFIGKDLDFIYSTKKKDSVFNFADGSAARVEEVLSTQSGSGARVNFKLVGVDKDGNEIPVAQDIIDAINAPGNLVFIHPDATINTRTDIVPVEEAIEQPEIAQA